MINTMKTISRKEQLNKEIKDSKILHNIDIEDTFVDFNPLDLMPDTIDKDYGFFMMFGHLDSQRGKATTNFASEISQKGLLQK
jgi:hypothetical protein